MIKKLDDIVTELNIEAYENMETRADKHDSKYDDITPFTLHSSGFQCSVSFFDICVWSSEDDQIFDGEDKLVDIKAVILDRAKTYLRHMNNCLCMK